MIGKQLQKMVDRRIEKETQKDQFKNDYGPFWMFFGSILGVWVLGIVGGIFDGWTIYSLNMNASGDFWYSLFIAASIGVIVQIGYGSPVAKATKVFHNRTHKEGKYRRALITMLLLAICSFSVSILFSVRADAIAENMSKHFLDSKVKDAAPVMAYYDSLVAAEKLLLAESEMLIEKQVSVLRSDKIYDEPTGKKVTRWANLKPINKLLTEDMPAVRNLHQSNINMYLNERAEKLAAIDSTNIQTSLDNSIKLAKSGSTLVGANVIINLFRLILIVGFAVFLEDAKEKVGKDKDLLANDLHADSDNLPEQDQQVVTLVETKYADIGKLKENTKRQWARSKTSSTEAARKRNAEKAQKGIEAIESMGFNVFEQNGKLIVK